MAQLSDILLLPARPLIAIVGAGGKTTTMYTLARELAARGRRVVTTTTTNIYVPGPDETESLLVDSEAPRLLDKLSDSWQRHHHITVASEVISSGKLRGLPPELPVLFFQRGAEAVIVEADGARHRRIKAPAGHEPVIPLHTNLVLLLLSAEALNQPLSGEIAHRPEILARLTGIAPGDLLTPTVVARLLLNEQGGLKHVPEGAPVCVLITHATAERRALVEELARLLMQSGKIAGVYSAERSGEWDRSV
jgi:probable selenium-dependent hydroxylase accessory protein YqeC